MSAEAAFHERWSQSAELLALVPATRFTTGYGQRDDSPDILPCVRLTRSGNIPIHRSVDSLVEQANIRLQVWAREHYAAWQIAAAIKRHFNGQDWSTADGRTAVVQSRLTSDDCLQEESDSVWQWVMVFEVTYQEKRP